MQRSIHYGKGRGGANAKQALLLKAQNYLERQELSSAQAIYQKILRSDAGHLIARRNMGATLVEQNQLEQALVHYEIALKYHPNDAELHYSLGVITQKFNKPWDAMGHYLRAIELRPQHIEAFENLANIQTNLCLYEDALTSYQHILDIEPGRDSTLYSMSLILLLHGEFEAGWELYEHRWATPDFGSKKLEEVMHIWNDPSELENKNVLIVREQGFGDTIQFCRYALVLAKLNAKVTVIVQPELSNLIKTLNRFELQHPIKIATPEKLNELEIHDYCLSMMSLPYALRKTIKGVPEVGQYLWSDEEKTKKWKTNIIKNKKPNIGVIWSGNSKHKNDVNRSISLKEFRKIFDLSANFHYLGNSLKENEMAEAVSIPNLKIWCDQLKDFSDTAALVNNMDIVVSVDTSLIHLAGALNKSALLLIPKSPDFRWLLNKERTPWYKSIEIIRSTQFQQWDNAITKVNEKISKLINENLDPF